jgi:hypothetical protein
MLDCCLLIRKMYYKYCKYINLVLTFILTFFTCAVSYAFQDDENIALNARYKYAPDTKYPLTKDPSDKTKLTDGKFAEGYFWASRNRTMGWYRSGTIRIDFDLGQEYEIHRVVLRSARGKHAGVSFPERRTSTYPRTLSGTSMAAMCCMDRILQMGVQGGIFPIS